MVKRYTFGLIRWIYFSAIAKPIYYRRDLLHIRVGQYLLISVLISELNYLWPERMYNYM
ncbi:uncharacterized protein F4817DRAFT_336256 [Daldinia loculata]|uniref:uncharacterized protein n=1 Tax=Daldinia loculata TaxID=103429 RepID=UPI0020C33CE9|nr:uncharacterized protein F4817DRAFT_336256 [Daldinia loculata]KAI1647896.1 hypothetical protein F4817DRAFT_336256 [Daldinia loculata]